MSIFILICLIVQTFKASISIYWNLILSKLIFFETPFTGKYLGSPTNETSLISFSKFESTVDWCIENDPGHLNSDRFDLLFYS